MSAVNGVPPPAYWDELRAVATAPMVEALRQRFVDGAFEIAPADLGADLDASKELLERVVRDGWLCRKARTTCMACGATVTAGDVNCPGCDRPLDEAGRREGVAYTRDAEMRRSVDWVVVVHGMNTSGAWQETFAGLLAATWGKPVPVLVCKYGIVRIGVVLPWRRAALVRELRERIVTFGAQMVRQGFAGHPDVVAHSFGTWLIGHVLRGELGRPEGERLRLGRVILVGCVLRPDFEWKALQEAGVVGQVLNHYGTRDRVVPFAEPTICDSGPSGVRGFDTGAAINVVARGSGHGSLLASPAPPGGPGAAFGMERSYESWWRPFLTLPVAELGTLPERLDPTARWKRLPWPLRGTLFPLVAVPLLLALAAWALACLVQALGPVVPAVLAMAGRVVLTGVLSLVVLALAVGVASRLLRDPARR